MADSKYCYPSSNVLINKKNIKNAKDLFVAEKRYTSARLLAIQRSPIIGDFDLNHLQKIHKYIFQDIYEWAGEIRTVEIGKGNLFCPTHFIPQYAETVFSNYYSECKATRNDINEFVNALAKKYGDLNALHPFREGNGRTQREFAREICLHFGYAFDLSHTTHKEMLEASKLSFNKGDNSLFVKIFKKAVIPINEYKKNKDKEIFLAILTSDDLAINPFINYESYSKLNEDMQKQYNEIYKEKIDEMKKAKHHPTETPVKNKNDDDYEHE